VTSRIEDLEKKLDDIIKELDEMKKQRAVVV